MIAKIGKVLFLGTDPNMQNESVSNVEASSNGQEMSSKGTSLFLLSIIIRRCRWCKKLAILIFIVFIASILMTQASVCFGSDIVYLDAGPEESIEYSNLQLACRFYGADLQRIVLSDGISESDWLDSIDVDALSGIVINSSCLPKLDRGRLIGFLLSRNKKVPLLITGLSSQTGKKLLGLWSGGSLAGMSEVSGSNLSDEVLVARLPELCGELAGQKISWSTEFFSTLSALEFQSSEEMKKIITLAGQDNFNAYPIFASENVDGFVTFFMASQNWRNQFHGLSGLQEYKRQMAHEVYGHFVEIAPFFIFIRNCCFEKWRAPYHFANLTIDDPWLIEPYGCLNFQNLNAEMKKANFHTTIAFIPWNFDRSRNDVVELMRSNRQRFSIVIHGNDHDHKEFDFHHGTPSGDSNVSKIHDLKIRTAIARMDAFSSKTGLGYERVMVFPHGMAPLLDIQLLDKYNFLATFNDETTTPSDLKKPEDPLDAIRSVSCKYEGFPIFRRYSPDYVTLEKLKSKIAIDLFLGNPVLLSSHSDMFCDEISAFNKYADFINTIQPKVKWGSLENISRYAYIFRYNEQGIIEVLSFSNMFVLENTKDTTATYLIYKEAPPDRVPSVDNHSCEYNYVNGYFVIKMVIGPHAKSEVKINNKSNIDSTNIDPSITSVSVSLIRYASDVRDMVICRLPYGRAVANLYHHWSILVGSWADSILIALCMFGMMATCIAVHKMVSHKRR
jgi:hypothetical protein